MSYFEEEIHIPLRGTVATAILRNLHITCALSLGVEHYKQQEEDLTGQHQYLVEETHKFRPNFKSFDIAESRIRISDVCFACASMLQVEELWRNFNLTRARNSRTMMDNFIIGTFNRPHVFPALPIPESSSSSTISLSSDDTDDDDYFSGPPPPVIPLFSSEFDVSESELSSSPVAPVEAMCEMVCIGTTVVPHDDNPPPLVKMVPATAPPAVGEVDETVITQLLVCDEDDCHIIPLVKTVRRRLF